jgi:uncharacterized repeat protein (TIGR03803 family)
LTTAGAETVLYSFGRGLADGTYPSADLIDINGVLYGTTTTGGLYGRVGPQGYGTVFAVNASGSETVLHNFGSPRVPDGIYPNADLTDVNGVLYGTTNLGGEYGHGLGYGTVFAVTTTGAETLLYSFRSGPADGQNPLSPISFMNGVFYGTTYYGGLYNKGTVFTVTSSGAEGILHSFGHGYDGTGPEGLIDVNGVFYGTTDYGGLYNKGTVFTVTRLGAEHVIHSFGKGADGAVPGASLIYVNGVLYGTTLTGGKYGGRSISGTVFAVTPAGAERVLHSFGGP